MVSNAFTPDERRVLASYFTNLESSVFALINLPEVVKGALFARYSRSTKSVRRLFLDEFHETLRVHDTPNPTVGTERAEKLYERVLNDYGDDSVAQLGGVHIACEGVSNILTKVIERGRLMSYLEQSTRYVPYMDRPGKQWKYHIPTEIRNSSLEKSYIHCLNFAFETYKKWFEPVQEYYRIRHPKPSTDTEAVYRAAIRAKALDTLRGLLPAATQSNVGIYGSGQAFESLLLHMKSHPLTEVRKCYDLMLVELRKVIPAFLTRVDRPNRGERWSKYLAERRIATEEISKRLLDKVEGKQRPEVILTDYDPEGEIKVIAAALYASCHIPDDQLLAIVRTMSINDRLAILQAYAGKRDNRRHKPGRAFERTTYSFDILSDYGAFRDLQRHRLLTIEWQELTPTHGYVEPATIKEVGASDDWQRVMEDCKDLYQSISNEISSCVAQYVIPMAYRLRFHLHMNAREAMHVIELRTTPQGHPAYRRVCQTLHTLIAEQAGHRALADAMIFANHSGVTLERLQAERETNKRRQQRLHRSK